MDIALITGSAGLIGSQAAEHFSNKGLEIVGIDNDFRKYYFGAEASTRWNRQRLEETLAHYRHYDIDIRDRSDLESVFQEYGPDIKLIIHTAAQPSHDWAAREPLTDFSVNATGTLHCLELARQHCRDAVFIFTSTNKVYGDRPNELPLIEQETRWEIGEGYPNYDGVDESMSIDACKHSLFGASKLAADILVQEYGRYFGMKTVTLRAGCLTGPKHSGAMLHGFLAYLMKCCATSTPYTILGYKGKQVRDNIHSRDFVSALEAIYQNPFPGEVYNLGGGRMNNCSIREAVQLCEEMTGKKLSTDYKDTPRIGDHIWYISNLNKFQTHYPQWRQTYTIRDMLEEILQDNRGKWDG